MVDVVVVVVVVAVALVSESFLIFLDAVGCTFVRLLLVKASMRVGC